MCLMKMVAVVATANVAIAALFATKRVALAILIKNVF